MKRNSKKKAFAAFCLLIFICLMHYYYTKNGKEPQIMLEGYHLTPVIKTNASQGELKLVTIFASFIDDFKVPNYDYRNFVQHNFLKMTKFACFTENVYFIIFTNSPNWTELIRREYPYVRVLPTALRGEFSTPMYKDLYRTAMKTTDSLFYMQVNSCNLYDRSLIATLRTVRNAWKAGQIRQKIFIVGIRHNYVLEELIDDETQMMEFFKKAEPFAYDCIDYTIVTKDTIDWNLYPEILIGRLRPDTMLVDYASHNEIETFDASDTIRLLHQTERDNMYSSDVKRNQFGNDWNINLSNNLRDHYSVTCSRYRFVIINNQTEVAIFDKRKNSILNQESEEENLFMVQHQYWVEYNGDRDLSFNDLRPSLVIIVLAYNKPESLKRLLTSLTVTEYYDKRIDLVISLDIGHIGYFDLPTLTQTKGFAWKHGKKKVVLKNQHKGLLHQWIEAYNCVELDRDTAVIILEDCLVLSPDWYSYLMKVMQFCKSKGIDQKIAGWTLETPVVGRNPNFTLKMFTDLYAENTSIVLGNIKRVRSFVPVRESWTLFIKWFMKSSANIPVDKIVGSYVDQLENRGKWTHWESYMWYPWFRYYLNSKGAQEDKIMSIFDRWGKLAVKVFPKLQFNDGANCYINKEILEMEHDIEGRHDSNRSSLIILPQTIEIFQHEKHQ